LSWQWQCQVENDVEQCAITIVSRPKREYEIKCRLYSQCAASVCKTKDSTREDFSQSSEASYDFEIAEEKVTTKQNECYVYFLLTNLIYVMDEVIAVVLKLFGTRYTDQAFKLFPGRFQREF
jgi:hypothetical protein